MKTPRQAEAQRLYRETGNCNEVARIMGVHRTTAKELMDKADQWDTLDPAVATAMGTIKTEVVPSAIWVKTKPTEDAPGYSIYLRPEVAQETLGEALRAALDGLKPWAPVPAPTYSDADLVTAYLIADVHAGLMAWGREAGVDWDTAKLADRLRDWMGRCVSSSPASDTAVIIYAGDTTHANDQTNQTPQSKHGLDVDTRFYKTMTMTAEALCHTVRMALEKHKSVVVVILPGNHDRDAYIGLRLAPLYLFRDDPRVSVYNEPGSFWVHQFGNVMLAAHHGDKAKPEKIVMFLADHYNKIWGGTRYRFLYTGHFHHLKMADIGGMQWEQLRPVTEKDAYSFNHAFPARAQMQAVTYHREHGEIQRVKVNA